MDPYKFMALIGKRVIHPGGRASTEALLARAQITGSARVLDVGCGVATTAGCRWPAATAPGSPRQEHVPADAGARRGRRPGRGRRRCGETSSSTEHPWRCPSMMPPSMWVIAEAVTMFTDRPEAAAELARVTRPGGRVLATELLLAHPADPRGQAGLPRPGLPRHALRHDRGLNSDLLQRRANRTGRRDRAVRDDDATRVPGRRGPGPLPGHHEPGRGTGHLRPEVVGLAHPPRWPGPCLLGYIIIAGAERRDVAPGAGG